MFVLLFFSVVAVGAIDDIEWRQRDSILAVDDAASVLCSVAVTDKQVFGGSTRSNGT